MGQTSSRHASTTCCCDALERLLGKNDAQRRDDFERTVSFLASVPLFVRQLPRCELPKLAQSLHRKVWRPGQRLVRQGEIGQAFFLIQDGEASVATSYAPGEPEHTRATLYPGDYFGGHTLMTERPNVASIIAKGPSPLVTLSMSRQAFEESGLKFRLRFPKRPAVCERDLDDGDVTGQQEHPQKEREFICSAIQRNGNLRALLEEASEEIMDGIVAGAERRSIKAGEVISTAGSVGQELFIVRSGCIQALIPEADDDSQTQSAETALAHSTMAERLLRKEQLLQEVFNTPMSRRTTRRNSRAPTQELGFGDMGRRNSAAEVWHSTSSDALSLSPRRRQVQTPRRRSTTKPQPLQVDDEAASQAPLSSRSLGRSATLLPPLKISRELSESDAMVGQGSPRINGSRRSSGRQPKQGFKSQSKDCLIPTPRSARSSSDFAEFVIRQTKTPPAELASGGPGTSKMMKRRMSLEGGELGEGGRYVTFGEGESFGELSLIYNIKQEANFIAAKDSVIYAVERRHFTTWFRGRSGRFHEYSKFLEEVYALSQLLSSERWELACQAKGLMQFRPHETVLVQGKQREARLWYLIWNGSAVVTQTTTGADGKEKTQKLADLYRSGHFGERSLLRGENSSQVTVEAGPNGVCCLTFDGETVLPILHEIFHQANNLCPSPSVGIEDWCRSKNRGWDRQISASAWDRQISSGSAGYSQRLPSKDGSVGARHVDLLDLIHISVLGRGSFGQVILVQDPGSSCYFALKTVSKGHVQRKRAERQIKWERELLTMLDSQFLITLHKTFNDDQKVYFLLEAALGGSLLEVIHLRNEVLMEDQPHGRAAAFYVGCIVLALEHMHERRIVHRDIKPDNVLLDSRGYAKVCDMGFARFVLGKTNTRVGTPEYMAPEMIDFPHTHDMSVDWWSLGVMTFELLAGQSPWEDNGISDPMERILSIRESQKGNRLNFPFHFPQHARKFVHSLLQPARYRLGATGGADVVRKHPMFETTGIDFNKLRNRSMQSPYIPEEDHRPDFVSELYDEDLSPGFGDSIYQHYSITDGEGAHWDNEF